MKQHYIDKIRSAAIKANPSILDLKFGCEVMLKKDTRFRRYYIGRNEDEAEDHFADIDQVGTEDEMFSTEIGAHGEIGYKIIGRPITLADIILVTIKKFDGKTKGEVKDALLKYAYLWNCFDDNLEHQSEETLKAISEMV